MGLLSPLGGEETLGGTVGKCRFLPSLLSLCLVGLAAAASHCHQERHTSPSNVKSDGGQITRIGWGLGINTIKRGETSEADTPKSEWSMHVWE